MYNIIKDTVLNEFQLQTAITEISCVMKSNPVTYVDDDISNLEPLTLNRFLFRKYNMDKDLNVNFNTCT